MNDYTQDVHVGADEEEKEKLGLAQEGRAPTSRLLDLIHKIDKLDKLTAEHRLAMGEAANEGEEKPVYVRISNFRQGRFGCDWYMYDLVKRQRVKAFVRMEWEGGVRTCHDPAVAVSGSVIYVLGGSYPAAPDPDTCMYCKDVLYFDTKCPQDGWKVGPQLPSTTHEHPFATSIHGKLYLFGAQDTVPSVLDTAVKEAGWKCLPQLHLPPSKYSTAHPDPSRDRILFTHGDGLFAYSLLERKWEHIDPNFDTYFSRASIVLGDVLYYHPRFAEDEDGNFEIMRAYDLVHCQQLTVVYHNLTEYSPGYFEDWNHLLDLGCAKLCLVKFWQVGKTKQAFFLKLKVEKETGENKVHLTSMSAQCFNMQGDDRYEDALTL